MNKKTAFKGMTLFEIVISILIYGVIALLLVQIMGTVNTTMRTTDLLNERLAYEQKFADNRLTVADSRGTIVADTDPKNLSIQFGEEGSLKTIGAKGKQYEIQYNSGNDFDNVKDVNYRYMVFQDSKSEADFAIPFQIPVEFAGGKSKYDITKVTIALYSDDAEADDKPTLLSDKVDIVDFDPVTHIVKTQQKLEDGNPVIGEDGKPVMEKVIREQVDRISGSAESGYTFIVPRKNAEADNGTSKVQIIFYGDVSANTGGDKTATIKDEADGETYEAGDFPFLRFNLTYCAWVTDVDGNLTGFYYDPELTFVVNDDLTISTK
jgi:Tfp pilus assembly protein PilE